MTYPHAPTLTPTPPKPAADPRYAECADCHHFPNQHQEPRYQRPWGGRAHACLGWAPEPDNAWKCRCLGWRGKITLEQARAAAGLA